MRADRGSVPADTRFKLRPNRRGASDEGPAINRTGADRGRRVDAGAVTAAAFLSRFPMTWAMQAVLVWLFVSVCAGARGPSATPWDTAEARRTPSRTTFPRPTIA